MTIDNNDDDEYNHIEEKDDNFEMSSQHELTEDEESSYEENLNSIQKEDLKQQEEIESKFLNTLSDFNKPLALKRIKSSHNLIKFYSEKLKVKKFFL